MDKKARGHLQLSGLEVRNFRCFSSFSLAIESPVVLIEGPNGSGKTSLLEALYYSCYLRSFRSSIPRELVKMGQDGFFIKAAITHTDGVASLHHVVQATFAAGKRVVKVDQRRVSSYKELMEFVRVISLTDEDLSLIRSGPQHRRSFLDRALLLHNPDYAQNLRTYRNILNNRNALLQGTAWNSDTYQILSQQLWQISREISSLRSSLLSAITQHVHTVAEAHLPAGVCIDFPYEPTALKEESFEIFWQRNSRLEQRERAMGRSLFGAHLDDFSVTFQGSKSRAFASRGQQKLLLLLLKIGQAYHLAHTKQVLPIMVLDDFMADFDKASCAALLASLKDLGSQLIFTSPAHNGELAQALKPLGVQRLELPI